MPMPPTERLYTVSLEFSATGEGMRVWAMVVVAPDELGARGRFWGTCFPNDPLASAYFGPGLEVTPGLDRTKLSGHTGEFLDRLETLARRSGAFAYQTYWHFNLS